MVIFVRCLLVVLVYAGMAGTSSASSGRDDYVRYCSACHGRDADGNGPVANVLHPRPPALHDLRAKFGKPLSTQLAAFISGTTMPRAHGTSDMPVWGKVLAAPDEGETARDATHTVWSIVRYLDSIQSTD